MLGSLAVSHLKVKAQKVTTEMTHCSFCNFWYSFWWIRGFVLKKANFSLWFSATTTSRTLHDVVFVTGLYKRLMIKNENFLCLFECLLIKIFFTYLNIALSKYVLIFHLILRCHSHSHSWSIFQNENDKNALKLCPFPINKFSRRKFKIWWALQTI